MRGDPEDFGAHWRALQEQAQAATFVGPAGQQTVDPALATVVNVEAGKMALWRGKWALVQAIEDVATPSGGSVRIACIRLGDKVQHVFAGELKA